MNLFRVRGIQLSVHFSFFLLLAVFAAEGWSEESWRGLLWSVALLLGFFTCVVLHELGHSFTAMHFGVGVRRILLLPIGGMAEFDAIPRQPSRELLITIAGPAVNFAIVAALWFFVPPFPELLLQDPFSFAGFLSHLFQANLVMGCFNLLPAFPMDGGRVLRALLATKLPYLRATKIAARVGGVIGVLGIAGALTAPLFGLAEDPFWLLAILFTFIIFVGDLEYRALKRREMEEARWRAMLAELHSFPPTPEEPPLLTR